MANRILKGLAIAAGTGLAMGLTTARTTGRTRIRAVRYHPASSPPESPAEASRVPEDADDEFLNIEPLLDRLERLEARVDRIGQTTPSEVDDSASFDFSTALEDLDRRVEENTREVALLREQVTEAERGMTESVAAVQWSVEQTRAEIPALIEQHVSTRIDDLRSRFAQEIEQSHQRTLAMFEQAIDEKISSRIGSIERALAEQAGSIDALGERATATDSNLQRLVAAVEKLCERAQLIAPLAEERFGQKPRQNGPPLPFESQLDDAMRREPVVPALRTETPAAGLQVPVPGFAGSQESAPEEIPVSVPKSDRRRVESAGFAVVPVNSGTV